MPIRLAKPGEVQSTIGTWVCTSGATAYSSAWFALDYGLAAGDIPNHGDVVLRTIIPTAGLHPGRREDWEAMRAAGQHVSISRLSPS